MSVSESVMESAAESERVSERPMRPRPPADEQEAPPPPRAPDSEMSELAVEIHQPGEPTPDVGDLVAWMRRHEGVDQVEHDPSEGTLVIHYDERRGAKRLLRGALLDRIFRTRARKPADPRRLEVAITHEVPGRIRFKVAGASGDALERLAAYVGSLVGVERAWASLPTSTLLVHFDPKATSRALLLDAVATAPPATWPAAAPRPTAPETEWLKTGANLVVLGAAVTGVVPTPVIIGAAALNALPSFKRAVGALLEGRVNVDVMDATAITICLARSEPITASVITTLLAIGDLILDRTEAGARTAISRLMKLDDGEAFVLDDGASAPRRVHPRQLAPGARIVVYPGSRVPADGVVVDGSISVDEKALTGESVPRDCGVGDEVMAASVALNGQAIVRVERAGGDTVAGRIVQILEGAGGKPMTLQKSAERYADRLVLPTFGVAGAAFAFSGALERLTSVLINDFGTGIRIAVPTAALAAMIRSAGRGVLIKGGQFLERLAETDTIVFDKTGTLTRGVPEVCRIVVVDAGGPAALSEREVAAYAAAAEGNQRHPVADAVRRFAVTMGAARSPEWEVEQGSESYQIGLGLEARVRGRTVHVGSARLLEGLGIRASAGEEVARELGAQGASHLMIAIDGVLVAVLGYADSPRPESRRVVELLRAGGRRRVILLSGDTRAPVEAIARQCGIDEAISEVLPEQKAEVVRKLRAEGRKVAMVGDGINDAPALSVADIGISLQGGTDVALETADVVLLEGGLERLPEVFATADAAMRRVKEAIGIVLAPNALAITAGALGLLSPALAAVINNGSTILASLHAVLPLRGLGPLSRVRSG